MSNEQEEKFKKYLEDTGLPATKRDLIFTDFQNLLDATDDWKDAAKNIIVTDENQTVLMAKAKEGRLFLREKRIAVERTRKRLKADILVEGRAIDQIAKTLTEKISPIEIHLKAQEDFVQNKRKAKEDAEFAEFQKQKAEKEAVEAAKVEAERLKKFQDEEAQRKKERAENERLKKEAAEKDAEIAREKAAREKAERQTEAAESEALKSEQAWIDAEKNSKPLELVGKPAEAVAGEHTVTCPECRHSHICI